MTPALHTADTVAVVEPGKVSVSDVTHYALFMEKPEVGGINIPRFCRLDDFTIGFSQYSGAPSRHRCSLRLRYIRILSIRLHAESLSAM